MGSLHALREFGEGRADVAGFHVPIGGHATCDRAPFLRWLSARRDKLIRFVDREQGLILARGNPAHVQQSARRCRRQSALRQSPARLGNAAAHRPDARRRALEPAALEGLRQRGVHASGGRRDGRIGRRRCRIRAARGGGRVRARLRPAGAGALLPRRSGEGCKAQAARSLASARGAEEPGLRATPCAACPATTARARAGRSAASEALATSYSRAQDRLDLELRPPSATRRPDRSRAPDTAA